MDGPRINEAIRAPKIRLIDENGNITEVKAIDNKRATPEMQKSAANAVKKIKRLSPAKQGGKAVRIKYTIPIIFRTQ